MAVKIKKPNMKRVSVYLPADFVDNFAKTNKGQTISDLIRYGLELTRQELAKKRVERTAKFTSLAGAAGKCGDPLAWSKINDIYDF